MGKKKAIAPVDYLWFALLAFGGFGLELLLGAVVPQEPAYILHMITSLIWAAVAIGLWVMSKRKLEFNIFQSTTKPNGTQLFWSLVLLLAAIGMMSFLWGGFKPVLEYRSANNVSEFIWQYVYYAFETILIFVTIAFGQKYGEAVFRKANVPWGGIFLSLTWGLIHILTQELLTGIAAFLWALMYGAVYVLCRKNPRYALPAIAMMFIL